MLARRRAQCRLQGPVAFVGDTGESLRLPSSRYAPRHYLSTALSLSQRAHTQGTCCYECATLYCKLAAIGIRARILCDRSGSMQTGRQPNLQSAVADATTAATKALIKGDLKSVEPGALGMRSETRCRTCTWIRASTGFATGLCTNLCGFRLSGFAQTRVRIAEYSAA